MLLKPDIDRVLEAAGLSATKENTSIITKLDEAGLSLDDLLNELASLTRGSESESLRLRAIEMGFRMHGALKTDNSNNTIPPIRIVISNENGSSVDMGFLRPGVTPIEPPVN